MWLIHECVSNQLCGFSGSGEVSTKKTPMQLITRLKKKNVNLLCWYSWQRGKLVSLAIQICIQTNVHTCYVLTFL